MRRALAVLSLLAASSAGALVDTPRTIWDLSQDADLIALATVTHLHRGVARPLTFVDAERVVRRPAPSWEWDRTWARLRLDQVVAGPALAEVDVQFWPGTSDPGPPDLGPGQQVLVFLARRGSTWLVEGQRYGALHPTAEALPRVLERIRSARTLLVRGGVTPEERLEWLVSTAENRATRWHGLWRLLMDQVPPDRPAPPPGWALPPLSTAQRERLARAFIAEPSTDETLPMMLELVAPVKDPRLDAAVVRALDAALADGDAFQDQLGGALELGLRRFTDQATARALVPPFVNIGQPDRATLKAAWRRAKAQLGLPAPEP